MIKNMIDMTDKRALLLFFTLFLPFCVLEATVRYSTHYNNFAHLPQSEHVRIVDGCLLADNMQAKPLVLLDSTAVGTTDFKYYIRIANNHSQEGKSYSVQNAGKTMKYAGTSCGVVFNAIDKKHYWAAVVRSYNTHLHDDMLDKRCMRVTLLHVVNGNEQIVKEVDIEKNVELSTGFNIIGIEMKDGILTVSVGKNAWTPVLEMPLNEDGANAGLLGCYVGPAAQCKIERLVFSYDSSIVKPIMTAWTVERLNARFAQSRNPYEGYWEYLDRDMEDKWLRMGGRYKIALVASDDGYDIIYIDGAQVKKSLWKTGQLKGRLKNTIFTDNFNGYWVDATLRPFENDVYATFESGVILNMKFPVYQSQMRFSKILE